MSMTREEAIKHLLHDWLINLGCDFAIKPGRLDDFLAALDVALSALRPITREQVENVWKGNWEPGNPICPICGKDKFDGLDADIWADWMPNFCPHCGAPMTDKALEITMKRMEEMRND